MRLAATVPLPCCRGCCCLRIQPQLLLDAVSGTHALDQSCEDDDAADKLQCQCVVCVCVCGVCGAVCVVFALMTTTCPQPQRQTMTLTIMEHLRDTERFAQNVGTASGLSLVCPSSVRASILALPVSQSASLSVCLSALHCHLAHAAY